MIDKRRKLAVFPPEMMSVFPLAAVFLFLVLGHGGPAVAHDVQFPGPVSLNVQGDASRALAVSWPGSAGQYLVVGMENGFLNLVRLLPGGENFQVHNRFFLGGRISWMEAWENPDQGESGIVVASVDPDRVTFLEIQQTVPFFVVRHQVDLPEDPGTFAFVGPSVPGGLEMAVSLPGIDQIAILRLENGSWTGSQILAAGDRPRYLVGLDLDQDGVREVITADRGVLSGNLGLFRREGDGSYSRTGQQDLSGLPAVLSTWDIDADGNDELVVGFADSPAVQFLAGVDGQLVAGETVNLMVPAENIHLGTLPDGSLGLFSSVEGRGLVEFLNFKQGEWVVRESYYPGCRPGSITSGDLNGDGIQDLVCTGTGGLPSTALFGNAEAGFWGFPALTLSAAPGTSEMADFNRDGFPDLAVAGAEQYLLSLFPGGPDGSLATVSIDQELDYLAGGLAAVEADGSEGSELALLDFNSGLLRLLDYSGEEGFQPLTARPVLPFPMQLHAADLDGDGFQDLYMARATAWDLLVLFGDGNGVFAGDVSIAVPTGAEAVAVADLDADGLLDLLAVDGVGRIYSFPNQGDRTFSSGNWVFTGSGASYLATGDLDGDQDLDVVVGNRTEGSLTFLENDSSGILVRRIGAHSLPSTPLGVACSDLDLSGNMDVLVNLGQDGNIGVVVGLGDWSFGTTLIFPGGTDINSFQVGDFNLDGYPDVLSFDQSLQLGLTMLNVDRILVAVDPGALAYTCEDSGLRLSVLPDRPGPWDLALGRGDSWVTLVRDAEAQLGRLDFDGRFWLLDLAWTDLATGPGSSLAAGGQPAVLRLGLGEGVDREILELELDPACGPAAGSRAVALLDWEREPWPNPFNPIVRSRIVLARPAPVRAGIYDLAGREVAVLLQGDLPAGTHTLVWDGVAAGRPSPAGVYFLRVTGPGAILSRKVLLLK